MWFWVADQAAEKRSCCLVKSPCRTCLCFLVRFVHGLKKNYLNLWNSSETLFFKIVISAQSIRWNLSTLSNPNPVLLRPIDVLCPAPNGAEWKLSCITHAFASLFAALSVHQLAAQGEMLYLATRIEQGETEEAWMSTFLLWHLHTLLHLTFSLKLHLKKSPIVEQVDAIWGTCSLQIWAVVSYQSSLISAIWVLN